MNYYTKCTEWVIQVALILSVNQKFIAWERSSKAINFWFTRRINATCITHECIFCIYIARQQTQLNEIISFHFQEVSNLHHDGCVIFLRQQWCVTWLHCLWAEWGHNGACLTKDRYNRKNTQKQENTLFNNSFVYFMKFMCFIIFKTILYIHKNNVWLFLPVLLCL